jgi:D-alanyl-D-alanine carboxypeptidase
MLVDPLPKPAPSAHRRRRVIASCCAAVVVALATLPEISDPSAAASTPRPGLVERLQRAIDGQVKGGVPGIVIHVVDPGRHLNWRGASGRFARGHKRPLRPGDSFRIASVTKTFTAAVVLRLAEDARLALDDPIGRYLDPALVARLNVMDGVPRGQDITIRQLLNHSSGIYDYASDEGWIRQVVTDPQRTWTPLELVDEGLARGSPYFAPGTGFRYSDTGYVLLGLIVERVTGEPLAAAYHRYILDPLRLRHTYLEHWEPAPAGEPPRAHQYLQSYDTTGWNPTFDTFGGGGLVSTSGDLTRFIRGLFAGKVFAHRQTLATMRVRNPFSGDYALGIEGVQKSRRRRAPVLWGHDGFFGSFMYYWPSRRISITGSNDAFPPRAAIIAAVLRVLGHAAP